MKLRERKPKPVIEESSSDLEDDARDRVSSKKMPTSSKEHQPVVKRQRGRPSASKDSSSSSGKEADDTSHQPPSTPRSLPGEVWMLIIDAIGLDPWTLSRLAQVSTFLGAVVESHPVWNHLAQHMGVVTPEKPSPEEEEAPKRRRKKIVTSMSLVCKNLDKVCSGCLRKFLKSRLQAVVLEGEKRHLCVGPCFRKEWLKFNAQRSAQEQEESESEHEQVANPKQFAKGHASAEYRMSCVRRRHR